MASQDELPDRRDDQDNWPDALWIYKLGGTNQLRPPHIYKDRNKQVWPIDLPKRLRHTKSIDWPPANKELESISVDLDGILAEQLFDPDYRSLNPELVRQAFYAYYAGASASFPPKSLRNISGGNARFKNKQEGKNFGDDCLYCFAPHFSGYCIIFVLAIHKIRLLKLRGACLLCKGIHEDKKCFGDEGFICKAAGCPKRHHHKELCTNSKEDLERQLLHK